MDVEEFASDLHELCKTESIPMSIHLKSMTLVIPDGKGFCEINHNKSQIKFFNNAEELLTYAAYKVFTIIKKRLPDKIHNRMILFGNYRFSKEYVSSL